MGGRVLPPGVYGFEDLVPGDRIETGEATITETLIDSFADLSGDRFEIHMDAGAARTHGFDDRVAHGLLVLSVVDGLKNNAPATFRAIASLGWDWSFRAPVLAGDTIRAVITVRQKRETRKLDRGILTLSFEVLNSSGNLVQEGRNQLMVYR